MHPIIAELRQLNEAFPTGLIAIGGAAVYLHAVHDGRGHSTETIRGIAFYLSNENLAALRDQDPLTPNPKLHKQQLIRRGIEMDVFLEHRHRLAIPYADLNRYSTVFDGVRIAAKEHLIALETDAAIDRLGSGEGYKAATDLVNLVASLDKIRPELLRPAMNPERLAFLRNLAGRTEPFQADNLRATFKNALAGIATELGHLPEPVEPRRHRARRQTLIPPNLDNLPARVSSSPFLEGTTTLLELCSIAGIPYRYVGDTLPYVGFSRGSGNLRAIGANNQRVLVVDLEHISAKTLAEEALRIIEVLAHSFHERAARECARGLFGFSKKPLTNQSSTTLSSAQRKAKQRARAAREGICRVCLVTPARPDRATCRVCAAKHTFSQGRRRSGRHMSAMS